MIVTDSLFTGSGIHPIVHLAASPHNETPQPFALSFGTIPKRQKSVLRYRAYISRVGILTNFPFALR